MITFEKVDDGVWEILEHHDGMYSPSLLGELHPHEGEYEVRIYAGRRAPIFVNKPRPTLEQAATTARDILAKEGIT